MKEGREREIVDIFTLSRRSVKVRCGVIFRSVSTYNSSAFRDATQRDARSRSRKWNTRREKNWFAEARIELFTFRIETRGVHQRARARARAFNEMDLY